MTTIHWREVFDHALQLLPIEQKVYALHSDLALFGVRRALTRLYINYEQLFG